MNVLGVRGRGLFFQVGVAEGKIGMSQNGAA